MWRADRRATGPGLLILLLLALGGCSSTPSQAPSQPARPVTPTPAPETSDHTPETETPPAPAKPSPQTSPHTPALCAWSKTRGVASLLAREKEVGTWQFFPGDDIVYHRVPDEADQGSEYRAILERPLNGPCDKERLILVAPVIVR
ncbi:hypothetical protein EZI54_05065 [Marinobacter halodurans]|uniref:Uncharacterized protein n=1 Tax=Marinobacter halodurans TaxID=2528979 RepID=A0ABY1ZRS8_9GAMM|nr:hypothetical protein [Marinobacter halodurans]TBW58221.1 hypothetical protein EZI54_05065 [Marinobacter halodurans]